MISAFEASLLGYISSRPSSRYDIMKGIQHQIVYWAGSPGAVYSAIGRLETKGMLQEVEGAGTKIFEITPYGYTTLKDFLTSPVSASKLLLDPVMLRVKLRGLAHLGAADRIAFYQIQKKEITKAKNRVGARRTGVFGMAITETLSDLIIAQLGLEEDLINQLLADDLANNP